MYDILTRLGKAEHKKGWFSGGLQKMTGSLSPRPEINKNAAVNAVFLFILSERSDLNDKILLSGSNLSLGFAQNAPNWAVLFNS